MDSNLKAVLLTVKHALMMIIAVIDKVCDIPKERRRVLVLMENEDVFASVDKTEE